MDIIDILEEKENSRRINYMNDIPPSGFKEMYKIKKDKNYNNPFIFSNDKYFQDKNFSEYHITKIIKTFDTREELNIIKKAQCSQPLPENIKYDLKNIISENTDEQLKKNSIATIKSDFLGLIKRDIIYQLFDIKIKIDPNYKIIEDITRNKLYSSWNTHFHLKIHNYKVLNSICNYVYRRKDFSNLIAFANKENGNIIFNIYLKLLRTENLSMKKLPDTEIEYDFLNIELLKYLIRNNYIMFIIQKEE